MASATATQFAHLRIPLEDVLNATDNFHDDNIIVRRGIIGPAYKGQLSRDGKPIKITAVRLDRKKGKGDIEFWTEVSMLSDLQHENLTSLIGFCDEKDEKIIITTYEAKGSLRGHLNSPNLTWTQRLKISIGVARAMSYLHHDERRGYGVIHRYLNSSSILLDDNWEAKLSGFMFSVKQSDNRMGRDVLCEPVSVYGYEDPAFERSVSVTHKLDIYSYGVVLLEILCGRKAFIQNEANRFLVPLAKYHYENKTLNDIIHSGMGNQMSPESLVQYSKVAYSCLEKERTQRPDMNYILAELEKALPLQLVYENSVKKLEHLKISLSHIQSATDYFSNTYRLKPFLKEYVSFYRTELEHCDKENPSFKTHSTVIIKRYPSANRMYGERQFLTEIEILSSVKHPRIATLLGFCAEASEMIVVLSNSSNGFLSSYLRNFKPLQILSWEKRLKICIDVAHTIRYIHYEMEDQKMMIHRDINSYNIGLDENLEAMIINFWWSVFLPPNQKDDALYLDWIGILDYTDPEYRETDKLKRESDVYGFGVVLFEILCGRSAFDSIYKKEGANGLAFVARRSFYMGTLDDMIDPIIKEETGENNFVLHRGPNKESLHTFIEIAHRCIAETQDQRPTMKVVVQELEKAYNLQKNNKDNPKMSLEELKRATQNFHKDNYIGGGGFGKVYKGHLQNDGGFKTIVAKRLDTRFGQGEQQFLGELQILLDYKHENVIGLVGYCDEKNEKIIVYEYAPKGSLDRYLNDVSLTWVERLNICIDVASALYFLHGGVGKKAKVIHRDIKSANILLDHDWKAKLADYGLALVSPIIPKVDYVIDHACGTPGYLDPLYHKSGFLTIESDIYSFGVVLLEILCGRSTFEIHKREGHYLPDFIRNKFQEGKHDEVVFEHIREHIMPESFTTFYEIAYQCLHNKREKRPTTKVVLKELKKALEFQVHSRYKGPDYDTMTETVGDTHKLSIRYSETGKQVQDPVSSTDCKATIISSGSKQRVLEHLKHEVILGESQVRMLKEEVTQGDHHVRVLKEEVIHGEHHVRVLKEEVIHGEHHVRVLKEEVEKVEMANKSRLALIQALEAEDASDDYLQEQV